MFNKSDANMVRTAWELSAGLLSFVIAIGIGWWFGTFLDRSFGTSPWMTGLFTVFGVAAGILNVSRTVSRALRQAQGEAVRQAEDKSQGD
jgi:F0F1-type ATP synthase assembly protein I